MKSCETIAREAHKRWKEEHRDSPKVSMETVARINEVAVLAARMAYQEVERNDFDNAALVRRAIEEKNNRGQGVKDWIAKATPRSPWKGADGCGYALECAMQYGFFPIDDDADVYAVHAHALVEMMVAIADGPAKERVDSAPTGLRVTGVLPGYESLMRELMGALDQAQSGKGAERHNLGGGIPFERQRMQQISELVGSPDGMVYQACKKITEGVALPTLDRKVAELYGAINYIAGIIVFLRARAAIKSDLQKLKKGDPRIACIDDDPVEAAERNLRKQGIPT